MIDKKSVKVIATAQKYEHFSLVLKNIKINFSAESTYSISRKFRIVLSIQNLA